MPRLKDKIASFFEYPKLTEQPVTEEGIQAYRRALQAKDDLERIYLEARARGGMTPEQRKRREQLGKALQETMRVMATNIHDAFHVSVTKDSPYVQKMLTNIMDPAEYAKWAAKDPTSSAPHRHEARRDIEMGDYGGAVSKASQAIARDPKDADAYLARAMAQLKLGNYPAAHRDARKAVELEPNNRYAQQMAAMTERRVATGARPDIRAGAGAGGRQAASDSGMRGFGATPASAETGLRSAVGVVNLSAQHGKRAERALSLKDWNAAREAATQALDLNPGNAEALRWRALSHRGLGDFRNALSDIEKGLSVAPGNAALLRDKAYALARLGDYRGALAAAQAALEADAGSAEAHYNRAFARSGLGDSGAMLDDLRQAASLNSAYAPFLDEALQLPKDSDALFLFTGSARPRGERPASGSGGRRSFRWLILAALVGGTLIALGVAQPLLRPAGAALTSLFTRPGAASAATPAPVSTNGHGLLRGQFKVIKEIGAGGMGLVFEGLDTSLERRVAIKKMRDELRRVPKERQRFVQEAKTVAALHHPNIVDIYAIVEEGDDVFLVFEHIAGRTVHDVVTAKGRLAAAEALPIMRAVAGALDFAHAKGVVHRDLKPSNVMVSDEGQVKVMDFGIARAAKDALNRIAMTNTVAGTPPYMAPEQEQGVVRAESDVYALGVCVYEALTGRQPFAGAGMAMLTNKLAMEYTPLSAVVSGLAPGFDTAMAKALQADPEKRFRSAGEFVAALEACSSHSAS